MMRLSCELATYVNKKRKNFCMSTYPAITFVFDCYKIKFVGFFNIEITICYLTENQLQTANNGIG